MKRHRVIVNPVSGRGAGKAAIPAIRVFLERHSIDYDLTLTERPWHAAELAQEAAAAGYQVVVGVGGDGTANELINGLMLARRANEASQAEQSLPALAMVGVGRGNDFAFGMGMPVGLDSGLKALIEGRRRRVDIGRAVGGNYPQGRYFGNGVGIGFDAVVGFEALKLTYLTGFLSYLVAVLKTVFLYYHAPLLQIEYDGETLRLPALMVSIMNGRRMGGGFLMAPHASPEDGLLDLCIASQVSRMRIFAMIPHFLRGTQETQKPIRTARARRVTVSALQGVLPAHADGETLCERGQSLSIELLPQQLEVICQASDGS